MNKDNEGLLKSGHDPFINRIYLPDIFFKYLNFNIDNNLQLQYC